MATKLPASCRSDCAAIHVTVLFVFLSATTDRTTAQEKSRARMNEIIENLRSNVSIYENIEIPMQMKYTLVDESLLPGHDHDLRSF